MSYSRLKTSLISHFFASLVSKITKRLWRVKSKTENADHSSIGQFYQHGLFFSQCSCNAVVDFYKFWNQILLKVLAYIFWSFSKSRNLNSDLYPRKSTGSNEKDFRAYLKPNFSNTFYEHSEQHIISRRSFHLFFVVVVFLVLFCFVFFSIWLDKLKLGRSLNNI